MTTEDNAKLLLLLGKYRRPERTAAEVARDFVSLLRDSRAIARLAEAECNRGLSGREEAREEALRARIAALVSEGYDGLTPRFGGDPRGYVVKLVCRDGEHNSWGGAEEGWGVG